MLLIYALSLDGVDYRYVGCTSKGANLRLKRHVASVKSGSMLPVHSWMRKHGTESIFMDVLEVIKTKDELDPRERFWIADFRRIGYRLLNCSDGGLGGINPSAEIRARIGAANSRPHPERVGVPLSAEIRAKIGAANKISHLGVSRGPHSPAHCAAISKANTGRVITPEWAARISAGNMGKNTGPRSPETRAKMSATWKTFFASEKGLEVRAKRSADKKGKPVFGPHRRWHLDRNIVNPDCVFCPREGSTA